MVYHYTNFIVETNAWWLRRVRPVWMGLTAIGIYYVFHRYYFFGKNTALAHKWVPESEWIERANFNKRQWGYNAVYKPTLERSRKKLILETLGEDYDYPIQYSQRFMIDTRTLEEILEEENNY